MLARQLGDRSREVHEGKWRKVAAVATRSGERRSASSATDTSAAVGVLAEAFGMRAIYFDIATRLPIGNNRSVPSLATLLAESDFVSLHVPQTPQTKT